MEFIISGIVLLILTIGAIVFVVRIFTGSLDLSLIGSGIILATILIIMFFGSVIMILGGTMGVTGG